MARTLERDWEQRLEELEQVEQQYAESRRQHRVELSSKDRDRIRQLARDLPAVWRASSTSIADRKAMLRLVIEAITLHPIDVPRRTTRIRVQWQSGAIDELQVARPGRGQYRCHDPDVVQRIRELTQARGHDDEIARQLNLEGLRTGTGLQWTEELVRSTRSRERIPRVAPDRPRMLPLPHQDRQGRYSVPGAMARFGVTKSVVHGWIRRGLVETSRADFGTLRNVYWLHIDKSTIARLMAQKPRRRRRR